MLVRTARRVAVKRRGPVLALSANGGYRLIDDPHTFLVILDEFLPSLFLNTQASLDCLGVRQHICDIVRQSILSAGVLVDDAFERFGFHGVSSPSVANSSLDFRLVSRQK